MKKLNIALCLVLMQICIFSFNTLLCCFSKVYLNFCANHCNPSLNVSFSYSLSYFFLFLSSDFPIQMVSSNNARKSSKISSKLLLPEHFYSSFKSEAKFRFEKKVQVLTAPDQVTILDFQLGPDLNDEQFLRPPYF